jgi:DNA modification methylase
VTLLHGDCVELMRGMPDNSVDAIVTDPPYELGFMGKQWDGAGIAYSVEMWAEALRVLKPGGHLLAFGGTRTYHRMACAIEDAGFEIRDSIHWVYGSGFPKSLNISKAIDKADGAEREVVDVQPRSAVRPHVADQSKGKAYRLNGDTAVTVAATDAAARWEGWGTALKPAHEPIVVARKPLAGTVAGNVLAWGTGGLNIDGCRVPGALEGDPERFAKTDGGSFASFDVPPVVRSSGRWPANVVFDRTAGEALDQQSGVSVSLPRKPSQQHHTGGVTTFQRGSETSSHTDSGGASRFFTQADFGPDDWPFVYQAKPSRKERNAGLDGLPTTTVPTVAMGKFEHGTLPDGTPREQHPVPRANHHPTVKPVALMRHLVRLVTPPSGTVLDPFAGSGTTLVAAVLEGFDVIGCEMTDEYLPIIEGRVAWAHEQVSVRAEAEQNPDQPTLL